MAYDRHLADKITLYMERKKVNFYEKEMMGGITWMVNEKMSIGIFKGGLMARVGIENFDELVQKPGASQMINGSRPMKGYLSISEEGFDMDKDLEFWIEKCLEFNPKAKSSKKKKKS